MLLNEVDMEVVSKETKRIHEMDFSNLLRFHHVMPNNHGNVEIELSTWILISHSLRHVN
jgi:hypothetical protein